MEKIISPQPQKKEDVKKSVPTVQGSFLSKIKERKNPFVKTPEEKAEAEAKSNAETEKKWRENYLKDKALHKAKQEKEQQEAKTKQENEEALTAQLMAYLEGNSPQELHKAMDMVVERDQANDEEGFEDMVKNPIADKLGYDRKKDTKTNITEGVDKIFQKIAIPISTAARDVKDAFYILRGLKDSKEFLEKFSPKNIKKYAIEKTKSLAGTTREIIEKASGLAGKINSVLKLFKDIKIPVSVDPILGTIASAQSIFFGAFDAITEGIHMGKSCLNLFDMVGNSQRLERKQEQKKNQKSTLPNALDDDIDENNLTEELIKINRKRIHRGAFIVFVESTKIIGDVLTISGNIATLASGGTAAPGSEVVSKLGTGLKIGASALKTANTVRRGAGQFLRNKTDRFEQGKTGGLDGIVGRFGSWANKNLGAGIDTSKASRHKRENYGQMGKTIFSLMGNFHQKPDINKAKNIKSYINATGVNYDTFIKNTQGKPNEAALMLFSAMKTRQASDKIHTDAEEMYGKNKLHTLNKIVKKSTEQHK